MKRGTKQLSRTLRKRMPPNWSKVLKNNNSLHSHPNQVTLTSPRQQYPISPFSSRLHSPSPLHRMSLRISQSLFKIYRRPLQLPLWDLPSLLWMLSPVICRISKFKHPFLPNLPRSIQLCNENYISIQILLQFGLFIKSLTSDIKSIPNSAPPSVIMRGEENSKDIFPYTSFAQDRHQHLLGSSGIPDPSKGEKSQKKY